MPEPQETKPVCTWLDKRPCGRIPIHKKVGRDEKQWAYLCEAHHRQLEEALNPESPMFDYQYAVKCWMRASGGVEVLARSLGESLVDNLGTEFCKKFLVKVKEDISAKR